jgi:soluble cytochrome b562
MIIIKIMRITAILVLGVSLCSAEEAKDTGKKEAASEPAPALPPPMFATNLPAGPVRPAPFSAEISADFIKKVQETSAKIEECKKQIAERQAYLYENNPEIKAYRKEMIEMQMKINTILEADKDLANLRLNRDILWTTMPALPKSQQQMGMKMGPRMPGGR